MHPSPTSDHRPVTPLGLTRFASAPGHFLSSLADSIGGDFSASKQPQPSLRSRFFSGNSPSLTSESSYKLAVISGNASSLEIGLDHHCGLLGDFSTVDLTMSSGGGGGGSTSLFRHISSPAVFLSNLTVDNGFTVGRSGGRYSLAGAEDYMGTNRLKSQLSFSSRQGSISHNLGIAIPDAGDCSAAGESSNEVCGHASQSYISSDVQIGMWEDPNSIDFSGTKGECRRDESDCILASLSSIDSQYALPRTALEMVNAENLFQIQQDTVPCRVRAKRGCATHPRSIAERQRRTRISDKLRKLQELVPNMDKQTSTSDMLDLAVEHIKALQSQVQALNKEGASCICVSKHAVS